LPNTDDVDEGNSYLVKWLSSNVYHVVISTITDLSKKNIYIQTAIPGTSNKYRILMVKFSEAR